MTPSDLVPGLAVLPYVGRAALRVNTDWRCSLPWVFRDYFRRYCR